MAGSPNVETVDLTGGAPELNAQFRHLVAGARALGLQQKFEVAHSVLDEVEIRVTEVTAVGRLLYLLERGRLLNSGGEPEHARPLFEEAWAFARSIHQDDLAIDAAHMVAIVAVGDERQHWNGLALELAENSDDEDARRWLGSLYNNMGWDAHDSGRHDEALALLDKAWAWHRERSTGWGERVAKWSVAKQLRFLDRGDEALAMQLELLDTYRHDDPGGDGFVHEEIGELLLAKGEGEAARPHFSAAFELLSSIEWMEADRLQRLERLAGL